MSQQGHSGVGFVDTVLEPLQECVVVIETGEDFTNGLKHSSLGVVRHVAGTGAGIILIQIVGQAAAVAVVQTRSREKLAVLDIGRAAKAYLHAGIESESLNGVDYGGFYLRVELSDIRFFD